jgi:hypothetical protein
VHAENAEGDEATENEQVRDSSPPEQESRQEDGEEDGKKGNEEVKRYKEVIPEDNSENIENKKREKGSIHGVFWKLCFYGIINKRWDIYKAVKRKRQRRKPPLPS